MVASGWLLLAGCWWLVAGGVRLVAGGFPNPHSPDLARRVIGWADILINSILHELGIRLNRYTTPILKCNKRVAVARSASVDRHRSVHGSGENDRRLGSENDRRLGGLGLFMGA